MSHIVIRPFDERKNKKLTAVQNVKAKSCVGPLLSFFNRVPNLKS